MSDFDHSTTNKDSPAALGLISLKGFCMGAADVVPGVSGGTMALILGIYQRLLNAIRCFDIAALGIALKFQVRAFIRHTDLLFVGFLLFGIACAIGFFTRVVPLPKLINTHPELVYGLFFGLIVGSVVVLIREQRDMKTHHWALLALGTLLGFIIVNLVPTETPRTWWFVMFAGAVAISAMILPGISGSFILLILQKYAYVFDALGRLDMSVVIPFFAGCAIGLIAFSRVLSWLLKRYYETTIALIIGLLVGSLWRIWPFQDRVYVTVREKARLVKSTPVAPSQWDATTFGSIGLALIGLVVVIVITKIAGRTRTHS